MVPAIVLTEKSTGWERVLCQRYIAYAEKSHRGHTDWSWLFKTAYHRKREQHIAKLRASIKALITRHVGECAYHFENAGSHSFLDLTMRRGLRFILVVKANAPR